MVPTASRIAFSAEADAPFPLIGTYRYLLKIDTNLVGTGHCAAVHCGAVPLSINFAVSQCSNGGTSSHVSRPPVQAGEQIWMLPIAICVPSFEMPVKEPY